MAKWIVAARTSEKIKGVPHSYIGWYRNHPNIHMYVNEPAGKTSLVQVHQEGNHFTILSQTTSHKVLSQPPGTKGTTLFKRVVVKRNKRDAMKEVATMKKRLAQRFDRVTGVGRR